MFKLKFARNWSENQNGNIAMIFAITLIPLLIVVGFAIDAQLAFSKKNKIQSSLDSATLAAARYMQTSSDQNEIRKHAQAYFTAMVDKTESSLTCDALTIRYLNETELEGTVECTQPTTLMRIIGREEVKIGANSTATYGIGKLDVAFVFDISGSMNDYGRLGNLKTAAKQAVETLLPEEGSAGDGDVRIAMASYEAMVDAGGFFSAVTGLKPRRTYTADVKSAGWEWVEEEYTYSDWQCETVCTGSGSGSGRGRGWGRWGGGRDCTEECDWVEVTDTRGEWQWVETTETKEHTIDSTCVYERGGTHAFDDTQPKQLKYWDLVDRLEERSLNAAESNDNDEGYLTAGYAYWDDYYDRWRTEGTSCNSSGKPFELSDDQDQIEAYIDGLWANGGTAGHQGIEWGWYLISERWSAVFDGSAAPLDYDQPDATKAMIIMTDGAFNRQYHNDQGSSFNQAEDLCDAIKNEGIVVYTVAFQAPSQGEEILEYCASGTEFAFKASNGQELLDSYQSIATSISDLRIAH